MTLRTTKSRRNPFAPVAGLALAVGAFALSAFTAAPARAGGTFERAFEAELGRIAAREVVHFGGHVLRLGHVDLGWRTIHPGYRGEVRHPRQLREPRHHGHHRHHAAKHRRNAHRDRGHHRERYDDRGRGHHRDKYAHRDRREHRDGHARSDRGDRHERRR